jgi:hypothetical protein
MNVCSFEKSRSQTRITPEERLFRQELPAHGLGIHRRNGIQPGNTSSRTRSPTKEGDSTGNYQLIDADSDLWSVTIQGSATPSLIFYQYQLH